MAKRSMGLRFAILFRARQNGSRQSVRELSVAQRLTTSFPGGRPFGNRYPGRCLAPGDIDKVYQTIREQRGKLDILFANAGLGEFARLGQIKEEVIRCYIVKRAAMSSMPSHKFCNRRFSL